MCRRVSEGGHGVPEETIRRRYKAGLVNFFELYLPLANSWAMYNAAIEQKAIVAIENEVSGRVVYDRDVWTSAQKAGTE